MHATEVEGYATRVAQMEARFAQMEARVEDMSAKELAAEHEQEWQDAVDRGDVRAASMLIGPYLWDSLSLNGKLAFIWAMTVTWANWDFWQNDDHIYWQSDEPSYEPATSALSLTLTGFAAYATLVDDLAGLGPCPYDRAVLLLVLRGYARAYWAWRSVGCPTSAADREVERIVAEYLDTDPAFQLAA